MTKVSYSVPPIRSTLETLLLTLLFLNPLFAEENPLVDLKAFVPSLIFEIRYATPDNFMKETLYPEARCLLRKEVAEKLIKVQERLKEQGLSLKIFDGYRPLSLL